MNTATEKQVLSGLSLANKNMFWGGVIAETLARLGVENAVMSPGSRSMPLVIGFSTNKHIKTIPVLDERSAAFFALGKAMESNRPVVLFCSSGTAAANFYPAIIEASISRVPLIVLTADRPLEGRDVYDRQTIDQVKMYSKYPRWDCELPMPEADEDKLAFLRQKMIQAFERSIQPIPGPVHINVPFDEQPLAPDVDEEFQLFLREFDQELFFKTVRVDEIQLGNHVSSDICSRLSSIDKGIIILGPQQSPIEDVEQEAKEIGALSEKLGWPVFVDAHSHFRNFAHFIPHLVTRYDLILRNEKYATRLFPECVLHVGGVPISKVLRAWLKSLNTETFVLDPCFGNMDCLERRAVHLRSSLKMLSHAIEARTGGDSRYLRDWKDAESLASQLIDYEMSGCENFFEGKVSWMLTQYLPERASVFISNSMPPRDMEFFGKGNSLGLRVFGHRGANGIDGILSSAMGVAHGGEPTFLVTGDLALLYDSNGFLLKKEMTGCLTIILINNDGGRIFENLPIHAYDEVFERYVVTSQKINFEKLAAAHNVAYYKPESWGKFEHIIMQQHSDGVRIIEVVSDGRKDSIYRKELIRECAARL